MLRIQSVAPSNLKIDQFKIEATLGTGSFGSVVLAQNWDGQRVAIKQIPKSPEVNQKTQNEIIAGSMISHDNVGKFQQHFEDETNHFLVFEVVRGFDLFTLFERRHFRSFTEREARSIIKQLVSALLHCHQLGVYHNDVKLDNIMINPYDATVKLIDFGLCHIGRDDRFTERVGSEHYLSPEIMEPGWTSFSGTKTDVWCLGVVLYALLGASFPFNIAERNASVRENGKHPVVSVNFEVSELGRDLITKMLKNDPNQRISMEEVGRHPWLNQL